jgi:hypothetical protein
MINWLKHNHQAITAIGAMLVGVAALFIAWEQARVMRAQQEVMQEQQHGSVYPVLQIDGYFRQRDGRQQVGVSVTNAGVGPALIDDVVLIRDEAPSDEFERVMALMPQGTNLNWSSMVGRVLAAGDTATMMEYSWPLEAMPDEAFDAFLAEWSHWDMTACYCSVFGRCWVADTQGVGLRPQAVDACPRPDEDLFEEMAEDFARRGEVEVP